jgi:penicillin amidase
MQAKNYNEDLSATINFTSPAQNFLYADKAGTIALRVNGNLPAKEDRDGRFLEWGNTSDFDWDTIIPRSQNPQIINPKSGYVTSSNQRSAGKDYPYYYTGTFEHFRNRIINRKLQSQEKFDIEEMKLMQGDAHSILAEDILPTLINAIDIQHPILDELSNWDYVYKSTSNASVLFEVWYDLLKHEIFDEIFIYKDSMNVMLPEDWKINDMIINDCENHFFDKLYTISKENCKDIINITFDILVEQYEEIKDESWADHKPVSINHYAKIPAFNRVGIKTDGVGDAINATKRNFGPSWRMVVSLGDTIEAYGIYPGGQSGNPASPYYDNMIEDWSNLAYYKLDFISKDLLIKQISSDE